MKTEFYSPRLFEVAVVAGFYDMLVGLWPLLSIESFSAVTGLTNYSNTVRLVASAWVVLGICLLVFSRNSKAIIDLGVASMLAASTLALAEISMWAVRMVPATLLIQAACETLIGITWIRTFIAEGTAMLREVRAGLWNS